MKVKNRPTLCLLTLLVPVVLAGCRTAGPELNVWAAGDMVRLAENTPLPAVPDVFNATTRTVSLFGAANETVSFQIVVDADDKTLRDVEIEFSDLADNSKRSRKIPATNVRAFRMLAVEADTYPPWYLRMADGPIVTERFYDPLVPLDDKTVGQPFEIAPNHRLAIWVDLSIPRKAPGGQYAGRLSISAAGRPVWSARIDLEVYNFVLPDARPVVAVGDFDYRDVFAALVRQKGKPYVPAYLKRRHPLVREGLTHIRELMRLAREHRLDLFDRGIHPMIKRDKSGEAIIDWTDYDAIVLPYLTGSAFDDHIGCAAWPLPFSQDWPDANRYGGVESQAYKKLAGEVLAACRDHFADRPGLAERTFLWPYRAAVDGAGYLEHARLAKLIRSVDQTTPILSRLPAHPPAITRWLAPKDFARTAEIFAPPGQWLNPREAEGLASDEHPLRGLWLSVGTPPYMPSLSVMSAPADARALAWFAMKYNCPVLYVGDVLCWNTPAPARPGQPCDGLFYPASIVNATGVLPSVRLKRLRRGMQDIAYLWILNQRRRLGVSMAILNAMVRYAGLAAAGDQSLDPYLHGWVAEAGTWTMARRRMAEEVLAVVHPETASSASARDDRFAWKHFDEVTHIVRVEQIRSRVTMVSEPADPEVKVQAAVTVELYNEYSRAVDLSVEIDKLPARWSAVQAKATLSPLPANARRTLELVAQGPLVAPTIDGKIRIPLTMTDSLHNRRELQGDIDLIRAGSLGGPISIDGSLADWPMRAGNAAGAFRLIGRRGYRGTGLATRQTRAFVLADETYLYFAIRCDEPDPSAIFAEASNFVRYSQLMAHGEDLVELILDPGGKADRTEQLYHLVIKANGVLIAEHGVGCDPPLGIVRPWAAGASVAVGRQDQAWIAEIRIPRSAFGEAGSEPLWGVNFTRFATQGGEASSWSGAARYFYDPRTLGAMFVPSFSPSQHKEQSR